MIDDVTYQDFIKQGIETYNLTEKQSIIAVRVMVGIISGKNEPTSSKERQELQKENVKAFMQHLSDQVRPGKNRIFIL